MNFEMRHRIIFLRKKNDLSQQLLADFSNIHRSTIAKLETGEQKLDADHGKLLAEVFQVPEHYFQEKTDSLGAAQVIERIFSYLLTEELDKLRHIFDTIKYRLSLRQEFLFKILEAVYYLRQGEFNKFNALQANYFSLFDIKAIIAALPEPAGKYYWLFQFEINFRNRQMDECLKYCKYLKRHVQEPQQRGSLYLLQAQANYLKGSYPRANLDLEKAKELLDVSKNAALIANFHLVKSAILRRMNLLKEASHIQNQLMIFAQNNQLPDVEAMIHQHRGHHQTIVADYENAITEFRKAYDTVKNSNRKIHVLFSLIQAHIYLKDFSSAQNYIEETKNIQLCAYDEHVLKSYEAQIFLYQRNIRRHKTLLKKVLLYFTDHNLTKDLKYIYTYLAEYHADKNPKEAVHYYRLKESLKE